MIVDQSATNVAFADGRLPEQDLEEVMRWARGKLRIEEGRSWRLISARRKLSKVLFEIEEDRPEGPVRLIAKISAEERTRVTFDALRSLWDAGFRPPARYTVVEPVAYLPERDLIILERAPGVELLDKIQGCAPEARELVEETAIWLARLHAANVRFERWREAANRADGWVRDLATVLPEFHERMRSIVERSREMTAARKPEIVPCHGDFHPLNMFVADSGRLTGIDVDKFGGRDRAEEVGYFLCQTACIGFHRMGSFAATLELRRAFLDSYTRSARAVEAEAMAPYMAVTILKNLHFDLFAYKSGRLHIAPEWLDAADACLAGRIHMA